MFNRNGYMGPANNNFAPVSNKIIVKNLEDALRRYADFDSEMLYIDANQNLLYNVYTDVRGEKTYDIYEVKKIEPVKEQTVNNDTINQILNKLENLSNKVEDLYAKRDVEQTATTK